MQFHHPHAYRLQVIEALQAEIPEVWDALLDNGTVIRVAEGVFFHRRALDEIIERVRAHLAEHRTMTAAQFRDLIGSTRKYAVPLLEWLDQARVTRRVGDERILF